MNLLKAKRNTINRVKDKGKKPILFFNANENTNRGL